MKTKILAALLLASCAALASDSFEVKISATESQSLEWVVEHRAQLAEAEKRLAADKASFEARVAAIVSEVCARHGIDPASEFYLSNDRTSLIVTPPAHVASGVR